MNLKMTTNHLNKHSKNLENFILENPEKYANILAAPPYSLKISSQYPYILFKYSQIESDFSNPIVREARGAIFRVDSLKCVRRAFDKFFNYGEPNNNVEIDWASAKVQEKIDGSLISTWYDDGKWHYSTNGTIDAFSAVASSFNGTFGDIFEEALKNNNLTLSKFEELMTPGACYTFELVSPLTRVVIPYKMADLYLIGVRDMTTEEEYDPKQTLLAQVLKSPKIYSFHSLNDVISASKKLPWNEEGYVVVDKNFNRIKIKSPEYLKAHYARCNDQVSMSSLVDVILEGNKNEFLVYADEYKEKLEEIEQNINAIWSAMSEAKKEILLLATKNAKYTKKEYALEVKNYPSILQAFLFSNESDPKKWTEKNWSCNAWIRNIKLWNNEK